MEIQANIIYSCHFGPMAPRWSRDCSENCQRCSPSAALGSVPLTHDFLRDVAALSDTQGALLLWDYHRTSWGKDKSDFLSAFSCLPQASPSFQPLKALLLLSALSKDLRWSIYSVYRVIGWKDVLKMPQMKRCCKKIIFTLIDWLQSIVLWISGWVFIQLIFYSHVQMLWTTMTSLKSLLALASISSTQGTLISCV